MIFGEFDKKQAMLSEPVKENDIMDKYLYANYTHTP